MSFFCMQILVVIEPLLIDEDYYARVEGREIISNLAKVTWSTLFFLSFYPMNYMDCGLCEPFSPVQPVRGQIRASRSLD